MAQDSTISLREFYYKSKKGLKHSQRYKIRKGVSTTLYMDPGNMWGSGAGTQAGL